MESLKLKTSFYVTKKNYDNSVEWGEKAAKYKATLILSADLTNSQICIFFETISNLHYDLWFEEIDCRQLDDRIWDIEMLADGVFADVVRRCEKFSYPAKFEVRKEQIENLFKVIANCPTICT